MKRRLVIPALIALLSLAGVGASDAAVEQKEGLRIQFDADFVPHSLPRNRPAPVDIRIHGAISTTDGSHPPPLRWLEVELNRNGRISTKGLPVCSGPLLQSTSTNQALARCGRALVGHGRFKAQINLGSEIPAAGEIVAFNGRRDGRSTLLLHFFIKVPVRLTLVVPLTIGHRVEGEYGTVLRAQVPRLGGGVGSITEIDLSIGRRYSFAAERHSYISAACSAPSGFQEGLFPFARARFRFESHKTIQPEALNKRCYVRGG